MDRMTDSMDRKRLAQWGEKQDVQHGSMKSSQHGR